MNAPTIITIMILTASLGKTSKQLVLPQDITTPPHETNPDDDDDDSTNRYYYNSNYDDDEADDLYTLDNNSFDYVYATGIDNYTTGNDGYDYDGGWYDDDDNDCYTYCSSNKDNYYNNTPNIIFDIHGNQFTIDDNDNVVHDPPSRTTTNKCHPCRMHHC